MIEFLLEKVIEPLMFFYSRTQIAVCRV